jgi:hypothetical protein
MDGFALCVGGDTAALLHCCRVEKMALCAVSSISKTLEVVADIRVTWRHRIISRTTRWWHGAPRAIKADKTEGVDDESDYCSVSSSSRRDERTSRNDGSGHCLRVSVRM